MATKGPMPKRSTQRLGHRTQAERERTQTVVVPKTRKLYGPALEMPDAHPIMAEWYQSLRRSGQAEFYEPSDWAEARFWVHTISLEFAKTKGPSAVMIATFASAEGNLLTTEGSRRRMRMELERSKPLDADKQRASGTVVDLRRRLAGG